MKRETAGDGNQVQLSLTFRAFLDGGTVEEPTETSLPAEGGQTPAARDDPPWWPDRPLPGTLIVLLPPLSAPACSQHHRIQNVSTRQSCVHLIM